MVKEEFRATFLGRDTIISGWVKIEGDTVYIKTPKKILVFKKDYVPILSNIKEHLKNYEERILINPSEGRSDEKARIFFFDIDTFEPYLPLGNPSLQRYVKQLETERNFLWQLVKEFEIIIQDAGQGDIIRRKMKDEYDFYTGLKPPFFPMGNKDGKRRW